MDELNTLFGDAEQLWQYIKAYSAKAGREATRTVLELYYVVKSPNTPTLDKTLIVTALGYLLLPNHMINRDNHQWLALVSKGAAVMLAYNRVKTHVTPAIKTQVEGVLNQWFNDDSELDASPLQPQLPGGDVDFSEPYPKSIPNNFDDVTAPAKPNKSLGGYGDDEEVVVD